MVDNRNPFQPALTLPPVARVLYLLLAGGVFLLDRVTKIAIEHTIPLYEARTVIPGLFQIVHARNQGIAFGLFADSPSSLKTFVLVFLSAVALGAVALMFWTTHPGPGWMSSGLALIMGGATGNLYDRVLEDGVIDFLDLFVGSFHWPAFNMADAAIVCGGVMLLWRMGRGRA